MKAKYKKIKTLHGIIIQPLQGNSKFTIYLAKSLVDMGLCEIANAKLMKTAHKNACSAATSAGRHVTIVTRSGDCLKV